MLILNIFCAVPVDGIDAEGWVMSSESCGFLSIGARYVREVSIAEIHTKKVK